MGPVSHHRVGETAPPNAYTVTDLVVRAWRGGPGGFGQVGPAQKHLCNTVLGLRGLNVDDYVNLCPEGSQFGCRKTEILMATLWEVREQEGLL